MVAINPNAQYSPEAIVKNGWIRNSTGKNNRASYVYVLKLIRTSKLPAVDKTVSGTRPTWVVPGWAIIDYMTKVELRRDVVVEGDTNASTNVESPVKE